MYDDEVDNAVAGLTSLLEPIMIVFLAVVVGTIVIALFLPLITECRGREEVWIIACSLLEKTDSALMTYRSLPPRDFVRARRAAFTLIELLTVIAIILVLAGLLLHIAGNANTKASLARAQAEIQAMSSALESYKTDNGTYPRNTDTDTLNAQPASGSATDRTLPTDL